MNGKLRRMTALLLAVLLLIPCFALGEGGTEDPTPTPAVTENPNLLKYGSKGDNVKRLQERLNELGYEAGTADGIFGKGTRNAVMAFQRRNGLNPDGQAGPQTLEKLYSSDALPVLILDPTDVLAVDVPMLVNKTHALEEGFNPANLVLLTDVLDSKLVKIKYKDTKAVREVAEALKTMLEAAKADRVTKWQISAGYRSWALQEKELESKITALLNRNKKWSRDKAKEAALRTVAEPGCSEHHLGLAIDINVPGTSFKGTKQCKWLHAHCWEYGFIVRYTEEKKDITGYDAEAWHIRYVGVEHAKRIHELGLCLEEYVEGIEAGLIILPGSEIVTEEIVLPDEEAA